MRNMKVDYGLGYMERKTLGSGYGNSLKDKKGKLS